MLLLASPQKKKKSRGLKPSAKQILLIPGNEKCCDCGKLYLCQSSGSSLWETFKALVHSKNLLALNFSRVLRSRSRSVRNERRSILRSFSKSFVSFYKHKSVNFRNILTASSKIYNQSRNKLWKLKEYWEKIEKLLTFIHQFQ